LRLYFLPDVILCLARGRYVAISYRDVEVEQSVTRFIEEEGLPSDAAVVGQSRRFAKQLPIAQYGVVLLSSSSGLNLNLNTSNARQSDLFTQRWNEFRTRDARPQARYERSQESVGEEIDEMAASRAAALKMLGLGGGVANGVTSEAINEAFRRLAQLYHPDKVAGLAPEFQALADSKMKDINAAYTLLKAAAEPSAWQTVSEMILRPVDIPQSDVRYSCGITTGVEPNVRFKTGCAPGHVGCDGAPDAADTGPHAWVRHCAAD
jgi:hypothetical protein